MVTSACQDIKGRVNGDHSAHGQREKSKNLFGSNKKRTLTNKEAFFALNIYVRTMNDMNEDILR